MSSGMCERSINIHMNSRGMFVARQGTGWQLEAAFNGVASNVHCVPYLKTDCSSTFEVANNSLTRAAVRLHRRDGSIENLETATGGVLEIVGH